VHDALDVDVLLTPVMSGPAIPVEHWKGRGGLSTVLAMNAFYPYTAQWNHAGVPAVSMPLGSTDDGLPLAVQLVARRGDDVRLMALAGQLERLTMSRDQVS
jgi:amidase